MSNSGAMTIARIKRTNLSEIIASSKIIHTVHTVFLLKTEIVIPAASISSIITGRMGGAIGGIPVINHEMAGDKTANSITNRQLRNILPTITGMNIGRNAGPNPRK